MVLFCSFHCRYLISQGANVGVVNSEGETPLDIAEEEAMEELLQNEINRQGTVLHLQLSCGACDNLSSLKKLLETNQYRGFYMNIFYQNFLCL